MNADAFVSFWNILVASMAPLVFENWSISSSCRPKPNNRYGCRAGRRGVVLLKRREGPRRVPEIFWRKSHRNSTVFKPRFAYTSCCLCASVVSRFSSRLGIRHRNHWCEQCCVKRLHLIFAMTMASRVAVIHVTCLLLFLRTALPGAEAAGSKKVVRDGRCPPGYPSASGVCCSKSCPACGGKSCRSVSHGNCCVGSIKSSGHTCRDISPPCIIDPLPSTFFE